MGRVGRVAVAAFLVTASATGCRQSAPGPERREPPASASGPAHGLARLTAGRRLVFNEEFDRLRLGVGRRWGWRSGSYADCVGNPNGFKLDALTPAALAVGGGALRVTAAPLPDGRWSTGLLTTGDSCDSGGRGFTVRAGDVVVARARLPEAGTGAWPAIWTWRDGGNEVDVFEWHADRPGTLEFVNHVRGGYRYWESPMVRAGAWLYFAVDIRRHRTTWYVGTAPETMRVAHSDRRGVGRRFRAHLVISLSADDGRLHTRPDGEERLTFAVDYLRVHRRAAGGNAPGAPDMRRSLSRYVAKPARRKAPVRPHDGNGR
ncbi:family 16 glycosylhydrolase [Thermomonospora umbrina]|uniref:Glycosyl hydrolase family 16 n=1 Tax=Thermomonospora umbrina TaxID=111806 RepID=A0A3D9SSF9_9ACTN|nr:family 16 glycosylhydrolase [Thermomonospora umbrina]REE98547.1 glycosyl hydrolase family 16 [Thermomonospora umbrina]